MERLEIEKKARVDYAKTYSKLASLFSLEKIVKYDTYLLNDSNTEVRVRKENDKVICTSKTRKIINNCEKNKEVEIDVLSSYEDTIFFFEKLGFNIFFKKEKEGFAVINHKDLVIELFYVNNIAFLEIEAKENCKDKEKEIDNMFDLLDVKKEQIERLNYYQIFKKEN